jgi:hypothetical protein
MFLNFTVNRGCPPESTVVGRNSTETATPAFSTGFDSTEGWLAGAVVGGGGDAKAHAQTSPVKTRMTRFISRPSFQDAPGV